MPKIQVGFKEHWCAILALCGVLVFCLGFWATIVHFVFKLFGG